MSGRYTLHARQEVSAMIFASPQDRDFAAGIAKLAFCNPFLPERIDFERDSLGADFVPSDAVWNYLAETGQFNVNVARLGERADALAMATRERLAAGERGTQQEMQLYEELVFYVLYHRFRERFEQLIEEPAATSTAQPEGGDDGPGRDVRYTRPGAARPEPPRR